MFDLDQLVRPNIRSLVPYSSARDEFSGEASVYLDANENSYGSPLVKWYNRYPDPMQKAVKEELEKIKGVPAKQTFLGNGSDECIDILFRVFCEPGVDNVIVNPPTYGMYEVSANINNVKLKKVSLTQNFQLDLEGIEAAIDPFTKLIWLCSPNNPTGNSLIREDVEMILNNFDGIVVIDEAYINFSRQRSYTFDLADYPNLVVLQTLSKAWGLAALRMGMAFASPAIINLMNRVKPPYNINQPSQELVLKALQEVDQVNDMIVHIVQQRTAMANELSALPLVLQVFPSDANFLLVKMQGARKIYEYLLTKGIVTRDRSNVQLTQDCLRITVGTEQENAVLLNSLREYRID
jgi:histidinol-phosphate aminotransferase